VKTFDVAVIGGGVIGASIAFELAGANLRVVVLDRHEPGQGASWAAAGMLSPAPHSPRDIPLVPLAKESFGLYPEFVAGVEEVAGQQTGYAREGALEIFFGTLAETQLNDSVCYHRELGLATESISTDTARGWEKLISPDAQAAAWFPVEGTVDPRALTSAVLAAAKNRGVEIWPNRQVTGLLVERDKCRGVAGEEERISAERVIVAAGYSSNEIANGSDVLARYAPTRPVRGQMVALRPRGAVLGRVVRSKSGYLVPRKDGRIIAGSTIEEAGSEKLVTPAGIRKILDGAMELVPDLAQAEVLEMWSGLRPGTPDDLPIIGPTEVDGLLIATGHYRNGILLAPVTARLISDLILRGRTSFDAQTFSPLRFSNRQVQSHAI
jgi:glycine oxidase